MCVCVHESMYVCVHACTPTVPRIHVLCRCRAEASVPKLKELNPYVTVQSTIFPLTSSSDLEILKEYQVSKKGESHIPIL